MQVKPRNYPDAAKALALLKKLIIVDISRNVQDANQHEHGGKQDPYLFAKDISQSRQQGNGKASCCDWINGFKKPGISNIISFRKEK